MNLLLIEPDKILKDIYCEAIQNEFAYEVIAVGGAQQAIRALDEAKITPDCIILELQLAQHNGIEFLHELRSYPEWKDIPVIVHTIIPQHTLTLDRQHLRSLGIIEYLYKPTTSLDKLCDQVDQTIRTYAAV